MLKTITLKTVIFLTLAGMLMTACGSTAASQAQSATQAVEAAVQTITAMASSTPFAPAAETKAAPTATATATLTPTLEPTAVAVASGPTNFPANVDPLTGLQVTDPTILDRSPILVKVANFPAIGRPHAGLSSADIVFEYYIGEGSNRFMALYYGNDSTKVGPVRSGRYVDAQLVPMYSGILAFAYADAKVYSRLMDILGDRFFLPETAGTPNCDFCDDGRNTVISVFADTAKLTTLATTKGLNTTGKPNLDGMKFDPAAPTGGAAGTDVTVHFGLNDIGEWKYDTATGKYLRWIENTDDSGNITMVELPDANTNAQLAFSNVIVLYSYYTEYAPALHDITVTDNTTGQRAVIFRDGQAYDVFWKSVGKDKPIQFFTSDGQPFSLKPGNSWMVFMGLATTETKPAGGSWLYTFNLP